MPYSAGGAIGAGIMAGVFTAMALYAAIAIFPRAVPLNVLAYLGATVANSRPGWVVYGAGIVLYLALAVVFALAHAGLHQAFDVETDIFVWGVLFGLGHWVIDGAALGAIGRRHPRVASGALVDPGYFVINLPMPAMVAFLGTHLLFGAFTAAFYDALR